MTPQDACLLSSAEVSTGAIPKTNPAQWNAGMAMLFLPNRHAL